MTIPPGKVYLVGAGPGDPGLLTRRGEALLARAEVVVYDHLASARLLDLAPAEALRLCAGKSVGHCTLTQERIHQVLIEHARAGRTVVRLKGGDPLVFGRGAEEAACLKAAGIPFEIVPGVTAGVGVTAYAGIPVTHRAAASAVAYVTGHNDPESDAHGSRLDWSALAHFPGTLVVYMGVTHLAAICRTLIRHGKPGDTPAALIESGTLAAQRTQVATLETLPEAARRAGVRPPALLVVGAVVALREELAWYEHLPLFGQRIVVTRPAGESGRAAAALEALGAEVLVAPTVEIRPITDPRPLDEAIEHLADYDWLVFTSSNGVRSFLDRLGRRGRDLRALGHLRLAAIGPTTAAALAEFRLRADLVPESYRSEGLAEALGDAAKGRRILLARADRGRTLLRDELQHRAEVHQVAVYHNADAPALPDSVVARLLEGSVDWITLTSSAIAARLHDLLPEAACRLIGREVRLASLSPVTSETAARLGWEVAVEAAEATWEGLVRSLVERVVSERPRPSGPATQPAGDVSAELQRRLDPLPQQERRPQDEEDVHGEVATEDPGGQVEQEDE
jgi:uroporphyrinogen III methyltransferase/synthase